MYAEFQKAKATIAVVVHDSADSVSEYWKAKDLPFVGLPDPDGEVGKRYQQQWKLLKLGRMPALFIIDQRQRLVVSQHGKSMADIPPSKEVLRVLADVGASP